MSTTTTQPSTLPHCDYCGHKLTSTKQHYCAGKSCKTLAARERKAGAGLTLQSFGLTKVDADDLIEINGMEKITAGLTRLGYVWDIPLRRWVKH